MNTYGYSLQNPLYYIDPRGQIAGVDDAIAVGVIAAVVAVACYATNCGKPIVEAIGDAAEGIASMIGDESDEDDTTKEPEWPIDPEAPAPWEDEVQDTGNPADKGSKADYCREKCSETALPSGDNGFRFWNCYNKCMQDDKFCE